MVKKTLKIQNKLGMHARPASLLVQIANKFEAEITIVKQEKTVNGKSILGLMMLAAECGSEFEIIAEGVDEQEAVSAIELLINNKFNED